jgi:hypothetical protein
MVMESLHNKYMELLDVNDRQNVQIYTYVRVDVGNFAISDGVIPHRNTPMEFTCPDVRDVRSPVSLLISVPYAVICLYNNNM